MKLWNDTRLRLSITRLGLEYLAALLLVGVFAVNTGNNLLYLVFSFMAALFVVSGWVSRRAIQGVEIESVEEGLLFARVKGALRVRLKDRAPRRVRGLSLNLELEGGRVEPTFHGGCAISNEGRVSLRVVMDRRGWARIHALELRTTYPFGFLEKSRRFPLDRPFLVLPHPRVSWAPPGKQGESARLTPQTGVEAPVSARPFREGDTLSRIHWKRTAQRGQPWVRELEDEVPAGVHLRLDLQAWAPGQTFEDELERLSGLILQTRIHKRFVSLEVHSKLPVRILDGAEEAWKFLAEAQAEGGAAQGPRLT